MELPEGAETIAFADDLALVVVAKTDDELMYKVNRCLHKINGWMESNGLSVAPEKTEAVLLVGRKKHGPIVFTINGKQFEPKKSVRYLGVTLDEKLNFAEHITWVTNKANKVAAALNRLMPRVGGSSESKRRVLSSVANSIVLYAARVWHSSLEVEKYRGMVDKVQRRTAIGVTRGQ